MENEWKFIKSPHKSSFARICVCVCGFFLRFAHLLSLLTGRPARFVPQLTLVKSHMGER